jgi:hypothetical protein
LDEKKSLIPGCGGEKEQIYIQSMKMINATEENIPRDMNDIEFYLLCYEVPITVNEAQHKWNWVGGDGVVRQRNGAYVASFFAF